MVEKEEPVQVCFTLCSRDRRSIWMHHGCKVYMDPYMASNGSCFMVTQTIFTNHLMEAGLTQNRETVALHMLKTFDFIIFYHVWRPAWIGIHWDNIWLRVQSHTTSHYTRRSVTMLHDHGGELGRPLDTFFGPLTILWSQLLARVWNGPKSGFICHQLVMNLLYMQDALRPSGVGTLVRDLNPFGFGHTGLGNWLTLFL